MKKILSMALIAATASVSACGGDEEPNNNNNNNNNNNQGSTISVTANLTADTTWEKKNTYVLEKYIFVEGGTLTIEAGTKILGKASSALVITNKARINAAGTAAEPIVFTSFKDAGSRMAGDWGGVVLLGNAKINVTGGVENIEGFADTGALTEYGGNDDTHDCGTIKYARIEFAGFELAPDNELNSLTLGGCGSKTVIDYVQVHKGADDGVEFFGGAANIKHIVISQPDDDGLDWDFGWTGKAQFVFLQQNQSVGNCAIEADSNKDASDAMPRSAPQVWNATFVGSDALPGMAGKTQLGAHLRRGTAGVLGNVIFTRFADLAIDVDGDSSVAQANQGALKIEHSIFFDNGDVDWPAETTDNDMGFDEDVFFGGATLANRRMDPMLRDMLNLGAPNPMPIEASPVMTGAGVPPSDGFFDSTATFVGAFGSENWASGWTSFAAN